VEKLHSNPAWDQLQQAFLRTADAAQVLSGLTELINAMALQAYEASLARALPNGLAMLAVGGFGRRELFPYSDVDILVLVQRESQTAMLKEALSEFVRLLWDAGLRLSHSVRTLAECSEIHEQNPELNISLLDRRLLSGDRELFAKLENKLSDIEERQSRALARHLRQLARTRHVKYQDTFYHLEPDVKETPGGLRDLHLIHWLGKLWRSSADAAERLAGPTRFVHSVRCFLHYRAGRDQNLLSFDEQEEITGQLFASTGGPPEFMREYFQNSRVIYNEARRALDWIDKGETSLLTQFRDWRSRLSNGEFTVSNERVFLRMPAQLESDPAIVLRLFEFVARHGIALAAETERRLEQNREVFAAFCAGPGFRWPSLRNILRLRRAPIALRAMHNAGLIQALFPEWQGILCLVVPDYYHRYTVDEHTLVAIEKLNELAATQEPAARRFAETLSEIEDLALLRFALLFHDAGKGSNSGDHSHRSVELARQAMQRMQMPADDQSAVEFLIEHHLDLSAVMNSRDLNDPATARVLADGIGTIERLKLLSVMTYADISAVNPGAMTPWRLDRLWQAYRATHQELVRELETDRIRDVPADLSDPAFIKGFPVRYLRTHTPAEIETHLRLRQLSRPTGVAVQIDRLNGVYRVDIVARDMPFLFASLAGAMSSFGMDILKAEAFSNVKGVILDTFVFADPKRTLELNPPEMERLQETLERVALGKVDIDALLRSRPLPPRLKRRTVRAGVHFDSEACETATLVEIIAEDRPRLLYDLAAAISSSGCNIDVVLIDTEGHKAIDVFYVASDGKKLTPEIQAVLEKKLLERL